MSVNRENSVKFEELVGESQSDKIGSVRVAEFEFQLCDHLQKIEGEDAYYATAFYDGLKAEGRDINGIYYSKMGDMPVALLPLSLLQGAEAMYQDQGQTDAMLARAVKALESLNAKLVVPADVAAVKSGKAA
ncbi:MAG: hypothetical protein LRZ85_07075 [Alphaproteobacteria bacterium]|nr:hypothetical protein [Alphaproteobacteria bacterium]MCD8520063.1 hypothetical protein [Alphaproteobacteria bacterium]MCD8525673.1 hypothetical protein [Alphaproteobacteria bacterium]MCD8570935.1 hypothetical protein [Alphaproteobacteria bacterium]